MTPSRTNDYYKKLRTYYLSNHTITWIYNYICERYQAVINEDGTITSWAKSSSDVPQGSILGPLLFALFINDLPAVLSGLYADDAQVYGHFNLSEINEGVAIMQQNAQAVLGNRQWTRAQCQEDQSHDIR